MTTDNPVDVEAIRARHASATRGPWRRSNQAFDSQHVIWSDTFAICNTLHGNDDANGTFLAASWQDVADLLSEVDRLRVRLAACAAELRERDGD